MTSSAVVATSPVPESQVRLTGGDGFVLALDRMMRRNGQHGLTGQTHIVFDSPPDLIALQAAAEKLAAAYPILNARVTRNFLTLVPSWKYAKHPASLPVRLWREAGRVGAPASATEIPSLQEWSEDMLNRSLATSEGCRNLRVDLVFPRGGKTILSLTWTHLLFDGKGAELIAGALLQSAAAAPRLSFFDNPAEAPMPLRERIRVATPVVKRFFHLAENTYRSLAGPCPRPGRLRFLLRQLDENQTATVRERATRFTGPLFNAGFYLACAARAHRQLFLARGEDPTHYVVSIPVQIRRKGAAAVPFQNCVTVVFFCLRREDLTTLETAATAAQVQFEEMMRERLDRSFLHVLEMMKRLPAPIYMRFVGRQFAGEITSFFHSFTGDFTLPQDEAFGAKVLDAYHIPSVSSPPGSGLFLGMFRDRLSATFSWRDNASTQEEAALITEHLLRDLTGGGQA
jgi:hypothetical protein